MSTRENMLAQELLAEAFHRTLHETATKAQEDFSYDGDEGEPAHTIKLDRISVNYPWIYVDFRLRGGIPLEDLVQIENRFETVCKSCEQRATYLNTIIGARSLRCRLIYRADLPRD